VDELTDPEAALLAIPGGEGAEGAERRAVATIARHQITITGLNTLSRATGFVRVVATASALGIAALGDAYQRANLVSNILFELLAGGLLFSVLVPTFVAGLDRGRRQEMRDLAGVLLGRALVVLTAVVVVGIAAGPVLMRFLTTATDPGPARDAQVRLGSFLLWFVMPQLLLYGIGAVATAILQADRRFVAASLAPVCNNVVVIAVMVGFAAMHDPDRGLALTTGEKWLLGAGTLAGTVGLTVLPILAAVHGGLGFRPRWSARGVTGIGALARKGAWGAGDIGLNQVLVAATIVFAGRVDGGVIAYQTAFTFFLLPHAVLAHPIFTARFPELSAHGAGGDHGAFARNLSAGLRSMIILLVPAAVLMAITAAPVLSIIRIGQLDAHGSRLVAAVLAAYMTGLLGYSSFFMLTRASYAIDDVRSPTTVYLAVTAAAIGLMALTSALVDGDARVVVLGLAHGLATTVGAFGLYRRLVRKIGQPVPFAATLGRVAVATVVGGVLAWATVSMIGWDRRLHAVAGIAAASAIGFVAFGGVLAALRTPELLTLRDRVRRRA
jgi:putative peptidoglycan lipid II flippase